MKPHSKTDHVRDADSLIVKYSNGIQFIDIKTGKTDSKLFLPTKNSVFVDLDASEKIFQVTLDLKLSQIDVSNYEPFMKHKFSGLRLLTCIFRWFLSDIYYFFSSKIQREFFTF